METTAQPNAAADRVVEAMSRIARAGFLPAGFREQAAHDGPLPLWAGQTNSQPSTVRAMLTLLDVPAGARVLDVGAGSGWTTALLAHLVGADGAVLGLEIRPDLAQWGAGNLAATGMPWAKLEAADPEVLGRPQDGPFDRILVSAMASRLPHDLVEQLVPGGVMVTPVQGRMLRIVAAGEGEPAVTEHGHYRFVPLITPERRAPRPRRS